MKRESHPFAGKTVILKNGKKIDIEDWWINVSGKSWMFSDGNLACMQFAVRSAAEGIPTDDEVLYGKIGILGYLVHTSEIESRDSDGT